MAKEKNIQVDTLKKFREYQSEFIKKHYTAFTIRFEKELDADVIKHVQSQRNITGYIRDLIYADMKKAKKKASK